MSELSSELNLFVLKQEALAKADDILEYKSSDFKDGFYVGCSFINNYRAEVSGVITGDKPEGSKDGDES